MHVRRRVVRVRSGETSGVGDLREVVLGVVDVGGDLARCLRVDLRIGLGEDVAAGVVGVVRFPLRSMLAVILPDES